MSWNFTCYVNESFSIIQNTSDEVSEISLMVLRDIPYGIEVNVGNLTWYVEIAQNLTQMIE